MADPRAVCEIAIWPTAPGSLSLIDATLPAAGVPSFSDASLEQPTENASLGPMPGGFGSRSRLVSIDSPLGP